MHSKELFCQHQGGAEGDQRCVLPTLSSRPALWRKLWLWFYTLEILHLHTRKTSEKVSRGTASLVAFLFSLFFHCRTQGRGTCNSRRSPYNKSELTTTLSVIPQGQGVNSCMSTALVYHHPQYTSKWGTCQGLLAGSTGANHHSMAFPYLLTYECSAAHASTAYSDQCHQGKSCRQCRGL